MRVLEFGKGKIYIQTTKETSSVDLFFTDKEHKIGSGLPTQEDIDRFSDEECKKDDTVILHFSNIESLRVLQDKLNALALMINGYNVTPE